MRNPWRWPRGAVLEYWTALMVCLVWIQCTCGMPHVIRI
ncbi:glutamate receptor ionotropic, kainate 3 isoform X1, partial [Tachysurus ichikawai]